MDWPEIIKQLTELVTAIGIVIVAVMTAWIKRSQTINATKSQLENQEIVQKVEQIVPPKE